VCTRRSKTRLGRLAHYPNQTARGSDCPLRRAVLNCLTSSHFDLLAARG
jgi:hypothetical protein